MFVLLLFYFEIVLYCSVVEMGFLMMLWLVIVVFVVLIVGWLLDCYLFGLFGVIGLVLLSVGMVLFVVLLVLLGVVDIGWWMMLCGVGFGFF